MKVSEFFYRLPEERIARYPVKQRSGARLLVLENKSTETGVIQHRKFTDILEFLNPGDLLLLNNTRVIPARMFGRKETGGKLEILLERILSDDEALVHMRASKMPKAGVRLLLEGQVQAQVVGRKKEFVHLRFFGGCPVLDIFDKHGHIPLPPYLDREDESLDQERYQTVYARESGAVAAPTAGLHFDDELLTQLQDKGVLVNYVTLHVGAGTFQSVRVEEVEDHLMHAEFARVDEKVCQQIHEVKAKGAKVVAVGTTTLRCIESAAAASATKLIASFHGETDIFIYPGYEFIVIDGLITNFHLPESTLLMLVSAFAGKERVLAAYAEAIKEQYRFFSYGDAMYLELNSEQSDKATEVEKKTVTSGDKDEV